MFVQPAEKGEITFMISKGVGARDYLAALLILVSVGSIARAGSARQKADSVHSAYYLKKNCPQPVSMSCTVPKGLSDPEMWVFLDVKHVPKELLKWTWAKPSQEDPTQWTELFEYQNTPRGKWTPGKYLENFKKDLANACPIAKLNVTQQTSNELVFELDSIGCPSHGDDEIDRFLFGKSDLFQLVYTVKGHEMSPEQRSMGMAALGNWGLNPPGK